MTTPLDAEAAAVVRAAHRGGTFYQITNRIKKKGAPMRPARAAQVITEQIEAGHLRVTEVGPELYYSRKKAGTLALKAWQQGGQP